jgi:hypothetical protein
MMHPRNLPCQNRQQHPREEDEEGEEDEEDDKKGEQQQSTMQQRAVWMDRWMHVWMEIDAFHTPAFQSDFVSVVCACHVKFEKPLFPFFRESAFSSGTLTN